MNFINQTLELKEEDTKPTSEKLKEKLNEIPLEIVTKYGVCCGKGNKIEQVCAEKISSMVRLNLPLRYYCRMT